MSRQEIVMEGGSEIHINPVAFNKKGLRRILKSDGATHEIIIIKDGKRTTITLSAQVDFRPDIKAMRDANEIIILRSVMSAQRNLNPLESLMNLATEAKEIQTIANPGIFEKKDVVKIVAQVLSNGGKIVVIDRGKDVTLLDEKIGGAIRLLGQQLPFTEKVASEMRNAKQVVITLRPVRKI